MKKASSVSKSMSKGKSMSSIQPYQQSRVTTKSTDPLKAQSKVSKAHSSIKLHQPLSIQQHLTNKQSLKQSKLQQSSTRVIQNSRKKIQSQLQNKKSYTVSTQDNPVSFRQGQGKKKDMIESKRESESTQPRNHQELIKQNKQLKQRLLRMQQGAIEDKEKIRTLISRITEIKREGSGAKAIGESSMTNYPHTMSKSKTTASYAQIIKTRGLGSDRQNQIPLSSYQKQQTPFRQLQSQYKYSKSKFTGSKQPHCGNLQCQQKRRHLQSQLYKQRIRRDELQQEKKEWDRGREQLRRQYQELLGEIQLLREEE